ncbi:conjugative transposon protein TraK [Sunxiuqinia indica]|uniref:conjugative transposon protein TraK n=1 Tax=Sunxiuqinia indica TaxID=2692584 RepID=UPI00135B938A|nr:conjugative transposon protein TraK [Sunxiuqinia indica]
MNKVFDIQRKFRFTVYILLVASLTLIGFSSFVFIQSLRLVERSRQKIYVLDNGQSLLLALRADISDNRPAEGRDHIKRFHELFFTMEPDKQYIENNVREAFYLADGSVRKQYRSYKENNVYNQVIASDISMTLVTDSVYIDFSAYPYQFCFYGKQRIVRKSTITMRSLVTRGELRNCSRTDNNPHGFLIENWLITDNKDLETQKRKSF